MKKYFIVIACFLTLSMLVNAQFKDEADNSKNIRNGLLAPPPTENILGFINPENFSMDHSISMSYSAFSGQGVAMGVYTNRMKYAFNDKLNVELDASIVNSPYNTLGDSFTSSLNGIYLSKAAVNYKPTNNTYISVQFRQMPGAYYYSGRPYYMSHSFGRDYFYDDWYNDK